MANVNRNTVFTFDLVYNSPGSLFLDLVFWLFKYVRNGANRLMGDLDVEPSNNVCDSLGKSFGVDAGWYISFLVVCSVGGHCE